MLIRITLILESIILFDTQEDEIKSRVITRSSITSNSECHGDKTAKFINSELNKMINRVGILF